MGSISEKLEYLNETKEEIKTAIKNKGVTVADTDTFRSYADKIDDIVVSKTQSKSQTITTNTTTTITPDTASGYNGLSNVTVITNIKTGLVVNDNIRFNYNLAASKTQTWTVPASATQAIITYVLCCDYQGGSATDGTPTCSVSGGTLTKLNASNVDNNERHRPYTWKLTKNAGKTATVTLRASYYNGANYGHRFGFCQIVWN